MRFSYEARDARYIPSLSAKDPAMTPTQDIGLPLLLEIDPLSPLEASLAGVLGASVAALLPDPQAAKRKAKGDDAEEEEESETGSDEAEEEGADAGGEGDTDD